MATEPGPRKGVADALTAAVAADMAAIDELIIRVRADLETLERWGAPMTVVGEWRTRLGLPIEEPRATRVIRVAKNARDTLTHGAMYLAQSPTTQEWLTTLALHAAEADGDHVSGLRAAVEARTAATAAAAAEHPAEDHRTELSSVDYAVKVLAARPETVMDVGEIAQAMCEAGWETGGNVRNVTVAVLGKAVERAPQVQRVGRGQYVWTNESVFFADVPEFSLGDGPGEQETGAARS